MESPSQDKKSGQISTKDLFDDLEPSTPVLAMLFGRVTNENSSPLLEVRVLLRSNHSFWSAPDLVNSTVTDDEGEYRFENLPVSSFQILVIRKDYYLGVAEVTFSSWHLSEEKNIQLKQGGLSLAGKVLSDKGEPIQDAKLLLYLPAVPLFLEEKSDNEGRFRFEGLWKTQANLSACATGYTGWSQPQVEIGGKDLEIILSRGGARIKGEVLTRTSRQPVPGASVVVNPKLAEWRNKSIFAMKCDEKGIFETPYLAPGEYELKAFADFQNGSHNMSEEIELVKDGPEEVWVELFLPELYDISGQVLDSETGEPIEGAFVRAGGFSLGDWSFGVSFPGSQLVQTDSLGRFRIDRFSANNFDRGIFISARAEGYIMGYLHLRDFTGQGRDPLIIKLKRGIWIRGTVWSENGKGVAGADLNIYKKGKQHQSLTFNRFTGIDGRFEQTLDPEWQGKEVTFYAFSPQYGFGIDSFVIPESSEDLERNLTLSPGIDVTVLVIDENGEALQDCVIMADSWKENEYGFSRVLQSGFEGRVLFENLPPFMFRFTARKDVISLYKEKQIDLGEDKGSREIIFSVDEYEKIVSGIVTDEQGNPLKNVHVGTHSSTKQTLTDSTGFYKMGINASHIWEVVFSLDGYETAEVDIDREKKEVRIDTILKKRGDCIFFGSVTGPDQNIPTEARIEVYKKLDDGYVFAIMTKTLSLKQGGSFALNMDSKSMKDGESYFVTASHPVYGTGKSEEMNFNREPRLGPFDIQLLWGSLKGYVKDVKTGKSITDAFITTKQITQRDFYPYYRERDKNEVKTRTDENGYYELSPLPFGSSDIYFYHPDYCVQKQPSPEITRENPESLWNPLLQPYPSLQGRILNHEEAPLGGVGVTLSSEEYFVRVESDNKGYYLFKGIPQGEYEITCEIKPYQQDEIYGSSMLFKVIMKGGESQTQDIHFPPLVPVLIERDDNQSLYFKPLDHSDFEYIHIYIIGGDASGSVSAVLPPGRFEMYLTNPQPPGRMIFINPQGENRISVK